MLNNSTQSESSVYLTETVHSASSSGGITEATSNVDNDGPDSTVASLINGTVSITEAIDFLDNGKPETIQVIELKSPVRAGEQYTILDRRFTETGIDADGDKKPDPLDVAVYARVIGLETLNLPNLPSMAALRVDTTVLTRMQASGDGKYSPVVSAETRRWYVEGVGLVQQQTRRPTASGIGTHETTEQLISWDGVNAGLGAMPPVASVLPSSSPVMAGMALRGKNSGFLQATATADHMLVFVRTDSDEILVSRLDLRGRVLESRLHPAPTIPRSYGRLIARNDGALYIGTKPNATGMAEIRRFDAVGALLPAEAPAQIDLRGDRPSSRADERFSAAIDGDTLWLLWSRDYYTPQVPVNKELVLRAFDLNGSPKSPELIVDNVEVTNWTLTAAQGKALITWTRLMTGGLHEGRYAPVTLSTSTVTPRVLVSGMTDANSVSPLLLDKGAALLWSSALEGRRGLLAHAAGLRLDDSFVPIRSSNGGLDLELIEGFPTFSGELPPVLQGSRLIGVSLVTDRLWPSDPQSTQRLDAVSWIDIDAGALAKSKAITIRSGGIDRGGQMAHAQLVFPDRVILFSGSNQLSTTLVWLPPAKNP